MIHTLAILLTLECLVAKSWLRKFSNLRSQKKVGNRAMKTLKSLAKTSPLVSKHLRPLF
jgi:hypothetical protein